MEGRERGRKGGRGKGRRRRGRYDACARVCACVRVCVRKRMEHGSPAARTSLARRVGEEGLAEPN